MFHTEIGHPNPCTSCVDLFHSNPRTQVQNVIDVIPKRLIIEVNLDIVVFGGRAGNAAIFAGIVLLLLSDTFVLANHSSWTQSFCNIKIFTLVII